MVLLEPAQVEALAQAIDPRYSTLIRFAGLVTAAAIPHLEVTTGTAVYLSSVSAHLTPPWAGMGLYLAAKVALEKCVEVSQEWQDRGYLAQEQLSAEDQAQAVVDILASRAQIDVMWSRPVTSLQRWNPEPT